MLAKEGIFNACKRNSFNAAVVDHFKYHTIFQLINDYLSLPLSL